jgi:hypothetical protein
MSKTALAIMLFLTSVTTTAKAATVEELRKVLCPFERQLAERRDHGLYSGEMLSAMVDARMPEVMIKAVMRDIYSDAAFLSFKIIIIILTIIGLAVVVAYAGMDDPCRNEAELARSMAQARDAGASRDQQKKIINETSKSELVTTAGYSYIVWLYENPDMTPDEAYHAAVAACLLDIPIPQRKVPLNHEEQNGQ